MYKVFVLSLCLTLLSALAVKAEESVAVASVAVETGAVETGAVEGDAEAKMISGMSIVGKVRKSAWRRV